MKHHKFAVGQSVEFRSSRLDLHISPGIYTVMRLLPVEHGDDCQYRVKYERDGRERIMRESQLASLAVL